MAAAAALEGGREVAEDVADAGVGEEQIGSELGSDSSRRLLLGLLCGEGRPRGRPCVWIEVGMSGAIVVVGFRGVRVGIGRTVARPVAGAAALVAASWGRATAINAAALIHSACACARTKWEAEPLKYRYCLFWREN